MPDDAFRMRAVIEDGASPALANIARHLGLLGKNVDTSRARAEIERVETPLKRLGVELRRVTIPALSQLSLAGGGAAAGVAVLATALSQLANRNADLKFMSREIGITVRELKAFQALAQGNRIDAGSALGGMKEFAKNAEDFKLRIGGLRDELRGLGAGDVVDAISRTKSQSDALRIAFQRMEELQERNPAVARRFAQAMFGSAEFARLKWRDFLNEIGRTGDVTATQMEQSERFRKQWEDIGNTLARIRDKTLQGLFPWLASEMREIDELLNKLEKIDAWVNSKTAGRDLMGSVVTRMLGRTPSDIGADPMGNDYARGMKEGPSIDALRALGSRSKRPGDFRLPGFRRDEEKETTKEGTKQGTIEGMRQFFSLQSFSGGGGNSGGIINATFGGSRGAAGGGGFGSGAYPNLGGGGGSFPFGGNTGGSGGGPADGGGGVAGGGGGGTRGDRNNNPGNMKFGPLAQAFGASGADNRGFAVFPNRLSGEEAQKALISSNRYSGLSLQQFAGKYAEGSKDWMRTVGGGLGIGPSDIVNNQDPRLPGLIQRAEGTGRGGGGGVGDTNSGSLPGGSVPSNVMSNARNILMRGGGTGELQSFMAQQGYPRSGAWCGQFAASVVKSAGGTPPKGAAVASNWLGWGQHVDPAEAKEGDIAVRKTSRFGGMVRQGNVGGHVGLYSGRGEGNRFKLLGGNQGRGIIDQNISQYEFRRGRIDDANSVAAGQQGKVTAEGTVNLNVTAPSGTKVDADSDGFFQKTNITRSRQMDTTGMSGADF